MEDVVSFNKHMMQKMTRSFNTLSKELELKKSKCRKGKEHFHVASQ